MNDRGFFEIGIYQGKTEFNLGQLWRTAFQMGAAGIFTIGRRYQKQASDTYKTPRHIPLREFDDFGAFLAAQPNSCPLVAVEMGGVPLRDFVHPERAIYLLGSEDNGLPGLIQNCCQFQISLPCVRQPSYNVAIAGTMVMFDRQEKRQGWSDAAHG